MSSAAIDKHTNTTPMDEFSYARLLNHLPGMAYRCTVDDDYHYALDFVSKGGLALLDMTRGNLEKDKTNVIEKMMREQDLSLVRSTIRDSIITRKSYELSYHITLASGQEKWIWDQGEPVYDDDGKCVLIEGIMMDITMQQAKLIKLQHENYQLQTSIKNSYGLGGIIGKSEVMQNLYQLLLQAAQSDTNVVLYGETGVGKDLAARTIHDLSHVKGRYIPVNCAAIPEQLLESEFFGHVKGAFSGAIANQVGYLGAAHNGTLFLDEVAELPLNLQVKLLRAIESKSYTPVGSNEVKHSNFRIISATNQDMESMVAQKAMRADFYYRLHVLTITIPPLRQRIGDLPLLIDMYAKKRGISMAIPPSVYLALEQHTWPGNIRELQNVLDRFWAFGDIGIAVPPQRTPASTAVHTLSSLDSASEYPNETSQQHATGTPSFTKLNAIAAPQAMSLNDAKEAMEKRRILTALEANRWKKGATAEALGITLRTLQRKVKKYGLND